MTWISEHKNQQIKIWWEWYYSFLLCRPHEHFWPFFTIQRQGIEQTTNLLFILKVLRWSNNLMQKMTSITPSIFKSIFQNCWPEILTIMKVLAKTTRGPVHLQLFRPSVIRGPCLGQPSQAWTMQWSQILFEVALLILLKFCTRLLKLGGLWSKSLYRSNAGRHFYRTENEIMGYFWAGWQHR